MWVGPAPQISSWAALGHEVRQALFASRYLPDGVLLGDLAWGRDTIDRRQIELVAAQTSIVNECFY